MWDAADDGAEHEGGDEGEEGQVDEALDAIIAEACEGLHIILRPGGTETTSPRDGERDGESE